MAINQSKLVVVGTVYPGIEPYLSDYFSSLRNQTTHDFDILLANDGLRSFDPTQHVSDLRCDSFAVSGSVAANRRALIRQAMEAGYQKIVFTDCDDMFEPDRIEVVNDLLETNAVVINDLDLLDRDGQLQLQRYFLPRFGEMARFEEASIRKGNLMGLSNTAARIEVFMDCPALKVGDTVAFDWYLWASILHRGYEACFTARTATGYRVYANNVAGMPQSLDEGKIETGIDVKCQHYRLMRDLTPEYRALYQDFEMLKMNWNDPSWRREYVEMLKTNAIDIHMWWENIRAPDEVGLG